MTDELIDHLTNGYREWFDAIQGDGTGTLGSMLADEWVYTNYDGLVRNRSDYLRSVTGAAEPVEFVGPYDVKVQRHEDIVLVFGGYHVLLPSDDSLMLRFSGVWLLRDDRWQCLMHHNSVVSE